MERVRRNTVVKIPVMRMSAVLATFGLIFCGFPIAFSAGNTIPAISHNQTSQETPASPRLAALQKELAAGNRAAIENFWLKTEARAKQPTNFQADPRFIRGPY